MKGQEISWDTLGPELGKGEYTVRLYGPREHTAWGMYYDAVFEADSPMMAALAMLQGNTAKVADLPRWRVTVIAGRAIPYDIENDDLPVLVGTFNPEGIGV
jgi:hypothetical protein